MIEDFTQFVDVHTHILPGVDDGPKNLEESANMARCYTELGITKIITTPHFIPGTAWAVGRQKIIEKIAELRDFLQKKQIPLQIYPGMEIAYHKKLIDRFDKGLLQPLANSKKYLIEPSFQESAEDLLQCTKNLQEKGQQVIIAHPERIKTFQESIRPLIEQIQDGLEVQLNSGSVLGKFGLHSQKTAMKLLENGGVSYIASDAHSSGDRKPISIAEWKELSLIIGDKLLTTLCIDHPQKLILNSNDK